MSLQRKIKCCICGAEIDVLMSNNPYPIREYSTIGENKNRCCPLCDDVFVTPARVSLLHLSGEEATIVHEQFKNMSYEELCIIMRKHSEEQL